MTSPTEQEIVARAMWDAYQTSPCVTEASKGISWDTIRKNVDTNEGAEALYKTGIQEAKAAISALDSHRAKNAGEVENGLDNLANHLFSLDSGSGEGKLLVQAANLISTIRSAIAEKDEALLDAKNVLISGCRMPLDSRIIGVIDASLSDGAK